MVNSHYVPEFFLKGFSSEKKLAFFDKSKNILDYDTPRNLASEVGFYSEQTESDLAKIETELRKYRDRFKTAVMHSSPVTFDFQMLADICKLMGSLYIRTPYYKKVSEQIMSDMAKESPISLLIQQYMQPSDVFERRIFDTLVDASKMFFEKKWTIVLAEGHNFITSDRLCSINQSYIFFPIYRKIAIIMRHTEPYISSSKKIEILRERDLDGTDIDLISLNQQMIDSADKYGYGSGLVKMSL